MSDEMGVLCVVDPYCQWSYGFLPTLIEFWEQHKDEIPFHVACAGLYRDAGVRPLCEIEGLGDTSRQIAEILGAEFGPAYEALLADGSFEMNSLDATRGLAALKDVAPEKTLDLAYAQMKAFFRDGKDLSEPNTYREIATAFELDADAVVDYFRSPVSHSVALQDFAAIKSAQLRAAVVDALVAFSEMGFGPGQIDLRDAHQLHFRMIGNLG